jgi:hemerythrin-like domain-containing protein
MNTAITILCDEHRSIAAVIKGLLEHVARVKDGTQAPDFTLFLSMFDYIETLPEQIHHPKENDYLFRLLRLRDPESTPILDELEAQHELGAELLTDLRQKLAGYRESGKLEPFDQALAAYAEFNWDHMGKEEDLVLPRAEKCLTKDDWEIINAAFAVNRESAW